jgi:hypothetical protein
MPLFNNLRFNTDHDVTSPMVSRKGSTFALDDQGKSKCQRDGPVAHQEYKHDRHTITVEAVITYRYAYPPTVIDTRDSWFG